MGDVIIGDLNRRRGQIRAWSHNARRGRSSRRSAAVEMFGYATTCAR